MIRIPAILLSPILMLSMTGCETFIPRHDHSLVLEDESVVVKVLKANEPVDQHFTSPQAVPAMAAMVIPILADLAIKKVGSELDAESKRYTADYAGFVAEKGFYDNGNINFTGVDIRRKIKDKDAISILLTVQRSLADPDPKKPDPNGMLQLVAHEIQLTDAKTKIADSVWYYPWTWGNKAKIDMDVNVTIEAQWIDDQKKGHSEIVANLDLPIRGIAFGKNVSTSFSSTPSAWFAPIPKGPTGNGTYVVKAKVTEYDDFGKRVKKLSEYIESNRESWVSKIKSSLTP